MSKINLLKSFENIPYFSIEGFKQASGMDNAHNVRTLLHRWSNAGHTLPLKKGLYMTRKFYNQHRQDSDFTAALSAILLPQSYISLEYILQTHNLLTEVTYPVTCITLHNTRTITNELGAFWYRHLKPTIYLGYTLTEYRDIRFARASLAKALFDFLYLRPIPQHYRSQKVDLAEDLRLNLEELEAEDWAEFQHYVEISNSPKMYSILNNFQRHL